MVDITDYIDRGEEEPEGEAEDLAALKACLQALADAVASTNLAVVASGYQNPAATQRVQASVAALKRFQEAFAVLQGPTSDDEDADEDEAAED